MLGLCCFHSNCIITEALQLIDETCPTIRQGTKFPRELRNHKSVYNSLTPVLDLFVQVHMFQCFIFQLGLSHIHTHTPTSAPTSPSPTKSPNYWRKKRLCFLNFMGNPTASSSQNTVKARHCHCCVLVFLLECKSQGNEFPYCRGTWKSSRNFSFFLTSFTSLPVFWCCSKNGEASFVGIKYLPLWWKDDKTPSFTTSKGKSVFLNL